MGDELVDRALVDAGQCDVGRGDGGLMTTERQEAPKLRRENRQLKLEREILSKAAAWFAQEDRPELEALFGFVSVSRADYPLATRPCAAWPAEGL